MVIDPLGQRSDVAKLKWHTSLEGCRTDVEWFDEWWDNAE